MKKALKLLCLLLVCSVLAVAVSVSALSGEEYEPEVSVTEAEVPAIEPEPESVDTTEPVNPFEAMTDEERSLYSSTLPIQSTKAAVDDENDDNKLGRGIIACYGPISAYQSSFTDTICGYSVRMAKRPADAPYEPGMMIQIFISVPDGVDPIEYRDSFTEGQLNAFRRAVGAPEVPTDSDTEIVIEDGTTISCMHQVADIISCRNYRAETVYNADGTAVQQFKVVGEYTKEYKEQYAAEMYVRSKNAE